MVILTQIHESLKVYSGNIALYRTCLRLGELSFIHQVSLGAYYDQKVESLWLETWALDSE